MVALTRGRIVQLGVVVAVGVIASYVLLAHTGTLPVSAGEYETGDVHITDCEGSKKGHLTVRVAESFEERYVGLSRTESLGPDRGMLFLFDEGGQKRIAMRNMDFDLDVLFVGADWRINAIETGDAPGSALEYYFLYDTVAGEGRYVIETSGGWAADRGISPGDCVVSGFGDEPGAGYRSNEPA